jgi:YhcN/YlaJ family sporulation lipoprotein
MGSALLLSASLAITGCVDNHTGEAGHKNIRPYYQNDYEKHGIQRNGVYSYNFTPARTRFADDASTKMNRRNGDPRVENYVTGTHGNHHIEWSAAIARQLTAMPEVDTAYVMVTDRNAYVAVIEDHKGGTQAGSASNSGALHDKIADQVRASSPQVQNVYVSSNPDFINRMTNYANAVGQGRPVQDFLTEFNAVVQRVFPSLTRSTDSVGSSDTAGAGAGAVGRSSDNGRRGTYGTHRSYGPRGTSGFAGTNR